MKTSAMRAARICRPGRIAADPRCTGCVVRECVESAALSRAALEPLLQRIEMFTLPAKRTLYREGETAEALYALRRGFVKLLREDGGGEPRLVRLLRAGKAAGLEAATQGAHRHTAVAIETLEFCRVPARVLRHLEGAGRSFYTALLRQWQANLDEADSFAASFSAAGAGAQRLARLLLRLGEAQGGQDCVSLLRSDLGSMLGVSKETASRLMAQFRRRGLIRGAGRDLQCDTARLREIADGA